MGFLHETQLRFPRAEPCLQILLRQLIDIHILISLLIGRHLNTRVHPGFIYDHETGNTVADKKWTILNTSKNSSQWQKMKSNDDRKPFDKDVKQSVLAKTG